MAKGIKVLIGNKELNLKGDEENLIVQSSDLVNYTLKELGYKKDQDLDLTTMILASLNLAENCLKLNQKLLDNEKKLVDEIDTMSSFLEKNFK